MRINFHKKLFFGYIIFSLILFLFLSLKDATYGQDSVAISVKIQEMEENIDKITEKVAEYKDKYLATSKKMKSSKPELKYILLWTSLKSVLFVLMGEGQNGFIERKCPYTNCFVTWDRNYLGWFGYTKFDVIAFASPDVLSMDKKKFPQKRSPHQKYVYATYESADNYPVYSNRFDGLFNWTWTYKFESEVKWGYIVVRDAEQKLIGPKTNMHWMKLEEMKPVSEELKAKLKKKTKAAAWFVSNCESNSGRENFVTELQEHLKKYDLTVDVYGKCGTFKCERIKKEKCYKLIENDYYFYLSFENSFNEDYVTEKLLHGLKNYAIPVVYSGANYTRFMPDGIYLNARDLGSEKLAEKMKELINNTDQYAEYFKWRNHYSYHDRFESIETDDYCNFCAILNNEELVKKTSIYQEFRHWWDPPNIC